MIWASVHEEEPAVGIERRPAVVDATVQTREEWLVRLAEGVVDPDVEVGAPPGSPPT
jgi:hypothetical protein